MEFKSYITEIEKQLNRMSEDEKTRWIYNQARIVDAKERRRFLDHLTGRNTSCAELAPDEIASWCNKVENGMVYLESRSYESYEDCAWDSDWVTEYYDTFPQGIIIVPAVFFLPDAHRQKQDSTNL